MRKILFFKRITFRVLEARIMILILILVKIDIFNVVMTKMFGFVTKNYMFFEDFEGLRSTYKHNPLHLRTIYK